MRRIDTSRLVEDEFRGDFIKYNKQWVVQQLAQVLSPRNIRRDRSRALAQLGRILLQPSTPAPGVPGGAAEAGAAIVVSSDSSSADEFEERFRQFRFASVSKIGQVFGAGWLAIARWRLTLVDIANDVMNQWLQSKHGCSRCGSFDNVVVEADPTINHLVQRYHHMVEITTSEGVDVQKWRNYLSARCEFAAVCKRCLEETEVLRDSFRKFSGNARKLAVLWLQAARDNISSRKRVVSNAAKLAISDDEESDMEVENLVRTAAQDIVVDEISGKLYQEWLNLARLFLYRSEQAKNAANEPIEPLIIVEEKEATSSESDYEFAGLDATATNIVGEVSETTRLLIDLWIDLSCLQLYLRHQEELELQRQALEKERAEAKAAEAARLEQLALENQGRRSGS